jgi:glycosyltransferase involved in cell wall biosynthesis
MNSAGYRSPVKIFDYMACGKAVVASKLEGTTDVFENSNAIALVEAENSNRLAEKIIELLSNDTKAQEMGHKGQRFVQNNFDRKSFAKRVHEEAVNIIR